MCEHRLERACHGRRCDCVSGGLPIGLRGDCEQAARLDVSPGAVAELDQGQEPESARREASGRGGLG